MVIANYKLTDIIAQVLQEESRQKALSLGQGSLLRFTWTLFVSSHAYSTLTHTSHTYDSSFSHLLHHDSSTPIVLLLYIWLDNHLST